jgi:hypothetical protein
MLIINGLQEIFMNQIKSTGDAAAFARDATAHYKAAIDLCEEDGRLRAFKYLLERLTVGGLTTHS